MIDLIKGEVQLFNKPLGWTSFQLVNKVRFILKHKLQLNKVKVGHAGTLDPLATGLVIICFGRETKKIATYQNLPKEYQATIKLGETTPSFDLETAVDAHYPAEHITHEMVENVLKRFVGDQLQEPPVFSAKFVDGVRAYKYARKGKEITLAPNRVTIYAIELIQFHFPYITIQVKCSKGTYIRALARDIGRALNSGAHLTGLIRQGIGDFRLENSLTIEEFERNLIFL